ncbi:amidohydrolase [Nocardioides cynanchi]|uniref:amidohydrolase n=1 Tax=Nocardioides cynanchi TaxID=2558918 RepID=UPI001244DA4E|nr:amidohydrolase family protein [Nocardioides cynanchi]
MADFVLRNVRVVQLGRGRGWVGPVDVFVEQGTVREIGHGLDHPAGIEEQDADGRWLIPGLWDHHVHLAQWTARRDRLDLAGSASPEEVVARVADHLARRPGPLVGVGHRLGTWTSEPTVAELDAVAPDVPVVLIAGDAHHGWLNSRALQALGLPDRVGVVAENEWYDAYTRIDAVAEPDVSPQAYRRTLEEAVALGVVGLVDLERGQTAADWEPRDSPLRVRVATYADGLDAVIDAGLATGAVLPGSPSTVTMGPLKIISDGSLNTRTAWCCEEYADGGAGAPNQTSAELTALLERAHAHGLEVATHAIGDRALQEALTAYDATAAAGSIEHAQLVRRDSLPQLARLGLRASVQPAHLLDDRDVTELCWPDRAGRCFAFRWMLDAGVTLALGSDAPVSPLDPWLAVAAAVHRSADERPAWHPEQALTVREALAASVDGQGSVHAGMPADLVLLDADPLAAADDTAAQAAALRAMPVAATLVGGEVVHGGL